MRRLALLPLFTLLACNPSGSFQGKLVDGLTGQPIPEMRLLAKAPDSLDLSCQVFEATTGTDGTFTFPKTCGRTSYRIETTDETWLLEDRGPFDGGAQPTGPMDVKAWRGSKGGGVYDLTEGEFKRVPTASDISKKTIMDTEEEVVYPVSLPGSIIRIEPGKHLLIAGEGSIKKLEFTPLVKDEEKRRFGNRKEWTTLDPWWYVGVKFKSDTDYERMTATLDVSKVKDVTVQGEQLRYIDGGALQPGRYCLMGDKDRRMYILDFGAE